MLVDRHGRKVDYLRLAIIDRCNLRCVYCMPRQGLNWQPSTELMTFEEMHRICSLLVRMGIEKIRITGGEPFVRKGLMAFLTKLVTIKGLKNVSITTNGVRTAPYVSQLKDLGIRSVNLSLDTLDRNRFFAITRRDELPAVLQTLDQLLKYKMDVKLNTVVMEGKNCNDIIPLVQLTKEHPISVRFIEEMPFNGGTHTNPHLHLNYKQILEKIEKAFPLIKKTEDSYASTSANYSIDGHKGTVGIIAAYSRTFCGTCNRIRLTPKGLLRTCLYDSGVLNLKDEIRKGLTDKELETLLAKALEAKAINGWEAQKKELHKDTLYSSMATIGG
ncbi:MAG TPA: GTP 3',8-cyclase MoaA [Chitinophagaceae bacterium]|nr:GTP 3',8-cyclase MoaA [Chitinophagaceae bacterium]